MTQADAQNAVASQPGSTTRAIAHANNVAPRTLTYRLKQLAKAGVVTSTVDASDKHGKRLRWWPAAYTNNQENAA